MNSELTPFVSFVSSGPGDPELLTLRALRRLEAAEVVLYDDLSAGPLLDLAAPGADLVSVGKRAGRASPRQDHVSRLLVEHALTGAKVVRLKSGDAGIFGRLEEEITALAAAGIGYEIVPGVSAPSAAAAAAGIPLTRRLTARRLQFITGADVTGDLPENQNWSALTDPTATTVVFMGQRNFPAMADELIRRGLPADTPAMLAEAVGHPHQRLLRCTVERLAAILAEEGPSHHPALIFYGSLAASPDWLPSSDHGLL